ncbi:DNA packaging protein UL32 [Beluga whale alphaherpesvirus 1]|uniref:Packaging protein UL32 n=1 Tax=Beluga whale alphaherpesvirus 1 TaxID=1434720 RepID=A0A286MM48_9ALPH|nr:DNA packaging protein UL32 [Beluga whale alphaherpesvirus 1]ASW27074.1 DNA packaging protein UL32 [Beluga whale alphaherpesvirus 1]
MSSSAGMRSRSAGAGPDGSPDAGAPDGARGAWAADAFAMPYTGLDPALLRTNPALCGELIFAAHLIETPQEPADGDADGDADGPRTRSVAPYVAEVSAAFAIDKPCAVCRTIEAYRVRYGLSPRWIADYAMLCAKTLAAPPCAVTIVAASFELVYLMDRHFLEAHNATLTGAFATRALTLADTHRHFFLHCCFRTDEGRGPAGAGRADPGPGGPERGAAKVQYSNYSFLIQSATRALLQTVAAGDDPGGPAAPLGARQHSLSTALLGWRSCAQSVDCARAGPRRGPARTCCDEARRRAAEYDGRAPDPGPPPDPADARWAYADLALLLLAGVACDAGAAVERSAATRRALVEAYWRDNRARLERDTAPRFRPFARPECAVDVAFGPIVATTLKHARCRGGTTGECVLCNLLPTREYWRALRRFREDTVTHSANNVALVDCIPPVLDAWRRKPLGDGGRLEAILSALPVEAVYKHFFCDPLCAVSELQTDPELLFGHPAEGEDLEIYKARLASENKFEGRVCAGLWALAYTFKTYQLFPPKPTAGARFLREAGHSLRRHGVPLVSLEHTLCNYV